MRFCSGIFIAVSAFCALAGSAAAQSCVGLAKSLGISPDNLTDGTTYIRVPKQTIANGRRVEVQEWQPLAVLAGLGLTRSVTGLYVVRDMRERVGVKENEARLLTWRENPPGSLSVRCLQSVP